jgi:hypothetical protein
MAEGETVQNIYDEIEIDDMDFEEGKFYYPCPCGDKFQITLVSILREVLVWNATNRNKILDFMHFLAFSFLQT